MRGPALLLLRRLCLALARVDCVAEEALSRVDAGDAGTEMADLLPSNLLKFAVNAVPFEMAYMYMYERAPWQPPVEATDRPPPATPTRPLRRTDGPQSGGHGSPQSGGHGGPQSGGHSGPRTGSNKTKQDKRKAKKARQKAKRRAAKAESAATKPSSPPVSPPDSLSSPPPRTDVQEMKPPSGEARHATAPQPNNPKTLTPRRPVGGEALIQKTPTRAAAATPAAAATADGEEDEECGAGVGW